MVFLTYTLYVVLFCAIVLIDQITKIKALAVSNDSVVWIDGFVTCEVTFNTGISWGLFNDTSVCKSIFLVGAIVAVIASLVYYTVQKMRRGLSVYLEVVVLAGALSNCFDRVTHGAVVDFIAVTIMGWHAPVFNLADVAIVVGVIGMLFFYNDPHA